MQTADSNANKKLSIELLNEASEILASLSNSSNYMKIDEPNKPFFGWTYSIVGASDRNEMISILKKLAVSVGKDKEILFAPSKQNENGIAVLSKTPESLQAAIVSVNYALVQLQKIISEDKVLKNEEKPEVSFGYDYLAAIDSKHALQRANPAAQLEPKQNEKAKPVYIPVAQQKSKERENLSQKALSH